MKKTDDIDDFSKRISKDFKNTDKLAKKLLRIFVCGSDKSKEDRAKRSVLFYRNIFKV